MNNREKAIAGLEHFNVGTSVTAKQYAEGAGSTVDASYPVLTDAQCVVLRTRKSRVIFTREWDPEDDYREHANDCSFCTLNSTCPSLAKAQPPVTIIQTRRTPSI